MISRWWWNFRFNLGYRIGGFTHAKRGDPDDA
jgi:hypothetical protein